MLAAFVCCSGAVQDAFAETRHDVVAAHAERRLVSVKIAGDPVSVSAVVDVLRERGAAADTTFEVVPAIDRTSVVTPGVKDDRQLARIWIDLAVPAGALEPPPITIYVVDGPWERVLVRPVVRQANPEITWEEIGHIVDLAIEALRAGESIGVAREELLPPAPAPAPPPASEPEGVMVPPPLRPARTWKLRAGAFYLASAYGSGLELASGPGLLFDLHTRVSKLELGATLTAEYRLPSTIDRGTALVHFEGGAFHALASGSFRIAKEHQLGLGVGGGIELVQAYSSSIELDRVQFLAGELHTIPTARVLARYAFTTSSTRLFTGLGIDVPLRHNRYVLTRDSGAVVLFEPWVVCPFAVLGIETN